MMRRQSVATALTAIGLAVLLGGAGCDGTESQTGPYIEEPEPQEE